MKCPECGARTEVSEKRGPFRNRHCTNPECRSKFVTCEKPLAENQYHSGCLRTLASMYAQGDWAVSPALAPPAPLAKSQAA